MEEPAASLNPIHTTIRIPAAIVLAYRRRANFEGTRYQTLMNHVLRDAAAEW
jgi:uncharacterized protein (DUF4415 family)